MADKELTEKQAAQIYFNSLKRAEHFPTSESIPTAFEMGYQKALEERPSWIDCDKRLPEFNVKVLVFGERQGSPQMGGAYISICERQDLTGSTLSKATDRYQEKNQFRLMAYVTHWMELPAFPNSK